MSKSLLSTEGRERNSRPRAGQEQRSGGGRGLDALEAGRPGKDYQEGRGFHLQFPRVLIHTLRIHTRKQIIAMVPYRFIHRIDQEMATYSSTLAWKVPWMEEPGRLQSMGSLEVGHD